MRAHVEVAVNVPQVSGVFTYHLPDELNGEVQPGDVVLVPFGPRTVQGVVVAMAADPGGRETRAVQEVVDPAVSLTPGQISLARWLAHEYLASPGACFGLMLPPGVEQVITRAMAKNPDERYATAGEMLQALEQAAAGEPLAAPPVAGEERRTGIPA